MNFRDTVWTLFCTLFIMGFFPIFRRVFLYFDLINLFFNVIKRKAYSIRIYINCIGNGVNTLSRQLSVTIVSACITLSGVQSEETLKGSKYRSYMGKYICMFCIQIHINICTHIHTYISMRTLICIYWRINLDRRRTWTWIWTREWPLNINS